MRGNLIYPFTLRDLGAGNPNSSGLLQWIHDADGYRVHQNDRVTITEFGYDGFISHVNHDFQRFLFASVESGYDTSIPSFGEGAAGWNVIRTYYAAFFAAHSLMRATGQAVLYVDGKDKDALLTNAALWGSDANYNKGTYILKYSFENKHSVVLSRKNTKAGVHEAFWSEFGNWLAKISADLLLRQGAEYLDLQRRLDSLTNILRADSSGYGWLSFVRNLVNYKHDGKLWLYKMSGCDLGAYDREVHYQDSEAIVLCEDWRGQPLRAFQSAVKFLCALNTELGREIRIVNASHRSVYAGYFRTIVEQHVVDL